MQSMASGDRIMPSYPPHSTAIAGNTILDYDCYGQCQYLNQNQPVPGCSHISNALLILLF
jgi:hypothetical protein